MKPPKEEAAEKDREYMIPKTFKKYCGNEYQLKRIKLLDQPRLTIAYVAAPVRPTFAVCDQEGTVLAEFHPSGYAECKKDIFRPIFERMVDEIEDSVQETIRKFE